MNYIVKDSMEEEMEIMNDLVADEASFSNEIDFEYEFDVNQFFDFTVDESESEAEEAENWFRFASEHPPSPFIVKLKIMKAARATHTKAHKTSSRKKEADKKTSTSSISDGDIDNHKAASREIKIKGVKHHNHTPQDTTKAKSKSTVNLLKPNGSSFMKPTASHLAKQTKECEMHSGGSGRLQKPLASAVEKLQSPIRSQNQATKRQKLEIGYLRKVAQLKHRTSFLHKVTKKAVHLEGSSKSKPKSTTPRKPALVTEERAQWHRSQHKSESVQQPKANTHACRARPLNRKILDPPKLPQCKKSISQSTEFQAFHLKTTERAMQVQSVNVLNKHNSALPASDDSLIKSQNSGKKDKCRSPINVKPCTTDKVHPMKDGGLPLNAKHNPHLPPTELFKKLSLKPESETKVISSLRPPRVTKVLKENVPRSFQQEFRRCVGKPNHHGTDRRVTKVKI